MTVKTVCRRLHRGEDLLCAVRALAQEHHLQSAVVLSTVGCVSRARLRDASGVTVRTIDEPCEIVSLTGTISETRIHLHISLSREDMTTLGGHLMEGCIINTTCELVLGELENWRFGVEQDSGTGYDEIVFERRDL